MYKSKRNIDLVCQTPSLIHDILTVENYMKWYDLYLITIKGEVKPIAFPEFDQNSKYRTKESPFLDHVPNAVREFAEINSYYLDYQSYEMIVGRWEIEVKERYGEANLNLD